MGDSICVLEDPRQKSKALKGPLGGLWHRCFSYLLTEGLVDISTMPDSPNNNDFLLQIDLINDPIP